LRNYHDHLATLLATDVMRYGLFSADSARV